MLFLLLFSTAVLAEASSADDGASALRFEISTYVVEGVTLLSKEELNAAVAPYVGKNKDFSDVQHALEAVEAAYAKRGYTAVQVLLPEQELANGRVRLRVVESRFGQVVVKGQKYFSEESVRNSLPSLRQGNVPRTKLIARELKLSNENPSRQLNVVLKSGKQDDQVDAEVQVTDQKPTTFGLSFDNSGTTETGRTRLGLFYRHANLLNADHVGTLQLQVSPQHMNRVRVFGGGYKIPRYASGDSVEFFGGYSNVNSVVGGLSNFQGGGVLLNARYNQMLERVAGFDPRLTFGIDWRDFKRIEQTVPSSVVLYNEIVVTPLSIGLVAQDKTERAMTSFDLGLSANIPVTGKGKKERFASYDPLGILLPDANYRILKYGASHVQSLGDDWQVRGALSGQWSRNVLILGEQMRLGGMDGVRGFSEGSEAGERGTRGTLEAYTPETSYLGIKGRALMFFDGGSVRSASGLKASITSAGFGLRATREQLSFRMDAGRIGKAGTDPLQKKGDWRIHAAVSATF
ncbi:MAG: ShlB/FhaC/HecB family hemolysin secretion/activation protein [Nitrosomonadales bacterium]|nr:ShlB/FhaC/HecB family hemolysin secretion/activation protein [Nitrosomonadales bacterium]